MKLDKEFIVKVTDGIAETVIDAAEKVETVVETLVEEAKDMAPERKKSKKCTPEGCDKPTCSQKNRRAAKTKNNSIEQQHLRAKCLEMALITSRFEEDAVKWAKRYWKFVQKGD